MNRQMAASLQPQASSVRNQQPNVQRTLQRQDAPGSQLGFEFGAIEILPTSRALPGGVAFSSRGELAAEASEPIQGGADSAIDLQANGFGADEGDAGPAERPQLATAPAAPRPVPAAGGPAITHTTLQTAPDGSPSDRTTVGAGEDVMFTASQYGIWTVGNGTPRQDSGRTFFWRAASTAWSGPVTFTPADEPAAAGGAVLEVESAPAGEALPDIEPPPAGEAAQAPAPSARPAAQPAQAANPSQASAPVSVNMTVRPPSRISFERDVRISLPIGTAGAGMKLHLTLLPLNVSFGNIAMREVQGPATGVSGYYTNFTAAMLSHSSANPLFVGVRENNVLRRRDTAAQTLPPAAVVAWGPGRFKWNIPNVYRVRGDRNQYPFTTTVQTFQVEGAPRLGWVTITKGDLQIPDNAHARVMRNPNAPV